MNHAEQNDLRSRDLCFLDIETTGSTFGYHEIIEIAVIRTSPRELSDCNKWLRQIKPQHPERISPEAHMLTEFDELEWQTAVASTKQLWMEFADFVRGTIPVCHNPSFERAFISLASSAHGISDLGLDYHWIGTESLAWPLYFCGLIPTLSLDALCRFYNLPPEIHPHKALEGARACLRVYSAFMRQFAETLPDLRTRSR